MIEGVACTIRSRAGRKLLVHRSGPKGTTEMVRESGQLLAFATLVYIAAEELRLRRADVAAPRSV